VSSALHPSEVLYAGGRQFPALAACEHYAGNEKLIRKALALQDSLLADGSPLIGDLIASADNRHGRVGARIHDVRHPLWREELELILARAGQCLAYLVLPKPECFDDVKTQIEALESLRQQYGITRSIPVHVLIETHGGLRDAWRIAALPQLESLDFGLMDFVSAHHGAIPATAMRSPAQFEHPLVARAKCEIAAAALGNGIIPAHNVTTEFKDPSVVTADALRARNEFGFLRMWSIHPNQIEPIIQAMRPGHDEVIQAADILNAAQEAAWGPIQINGLLHDRASYRFYWELLQRAHATGVPLPAESQQRFFTAALSEKG
jgi:citrate lyase subunit beta/citryl-CoA lyase